VPTILLVDDEPAITENLVPLLQRAGFEVVVALNGEARIPAVPRRRATTWPSLAMAQRLRSGAVTGPPRGTRRPENQSE
jgi:DNA-binding response OmpR family regulator